MKKNIVGLLIVINLTIISSVPVFANNLLSKTTANVNLREFATVESNSIEIVNKDTLINVISIENNWAFVNYNHILGYIRSDFLTTDLDTSKAVFQSIPQVQFPANADSQNIEIPKTELSSKVIFPSWSEVKDNNYFKIGEPAQVYDVKSGKTYYVKSFSNGNHADVEPITENDTAVMFETFGFEWSWDVRPVWVTVGGRTMAASINGMPHGMKTNFNNNMDGQICIHFKDSTTHNGNKSFEKVHQDAALEAFQLSMQ